jgi:3-oxoacyl-[acyl-carrier protein] reductase
VRNPADLEAIVGETVDRFGRLDILVANAGVGAYGPFLELSPEHLEEMIDVNVKGTLYAVRAALPHLIESGEADLVTIASEAGRRGLPLEAVYCASKFAQVGFTRAMDHELRERESGARTSARAGSRPSSPWAAGAPPRCRSSPG